MSKARDLANLIASGSILADGTLASTEIDGVTASAAELNILDGVTSTTAELNVLDGVTSTAAELNILDGVTSTAAELNILDGVTSTAAELNIFDGVTSTTAELNVLDGVTSTAAELNILDGVTSTAAELNILDGVTSTTAELNILDGVTSTTAELNILDGVTSTASELNILDGVTSSTAELNILDGVTANATEINKLDALSRGSILYGNSSGATAVLTKGTNEQVLTSDGTDISWADAGGGGAWSLLKTVTGSNAAEHDMTSAFSDSYYLYMLEGNVREKSGYSFTYPSIRFYNGSSLVTSNYYSYTGGYEANNGWTDSGTASGYLRLVHHGVSADARDGSYLRYWIARPHKGSGTGGDHAVFLHGAWFGKYSTMNTPILINGGCATLMNLTGLKIFWNTNGDTPQVDGTMRIWGMATS